MAVTTVAWDAAAFGRLDNADTTTNWTATGSGASPTVETDYYYQGAACISIQVKTSVYSLYYTDPTGQDMNTTPRVWMAKVIQTNKNAIDGNGLIMQIGQAATYYEYDVYNSNTYPTLGGFVVVPIAPTEGATWANNTVGTPNVAAVDHFLALTDSAFTAKAPNFGLDAIDIVNIGSGLTLTRGDSTDANGTFTDFVLEDEGDANNRWGHVQTRDGIIYVNGVLTVGNSTVNSEFTDTNRVLVFPNSRTGTGFNGLDWDLSNNTFVNISSCVFNGRGVLQAAGVDTRPDYEATGAAGTLDVSDSTFNTFRVMTLTSTCVIDGVSFLSGQTINQNSANLYQCTITDAAVAPSEAFIISDNVSRITECSFTAGANGGHAIELTTPGTYTMLNTFAGYDANGTSNAAIYNNSNGAITLNLAGGTTPTVTNGTGASTVVVSSATINVTNMHTESEIRIVDTTNNVIVAGVENVNGAVISVSIADGGTGYNNTDTLTVSGGTGTAATLNITTDGSGVIIDTSILTAGNYTVDPPNPVSTTGGSGTGAAFNLDIRGSFAYAYGGAPVYDIVVFHLDYKDIRFVDFAFPSSNSSLLISQIVDRVYANP
jgi:hypothetical protein